MPKFKSKGGTFTDLVNYKINESPLVEIVETHEGKRYIKLEELWTDYGRVFVVYTPAKGCLIDFENIDALMIKQVAKIWCVPREVLAEELAS